jgi:uncharacterized protein
MSDPNRPPGDSGSDPTAPSNQPQYTMPGETPGSKPAENAPSSGGDYTMPSGGGDYAAPSSGAGGYEPPPSSGGGGYSPPPGPQPPSPGVGGYAPPPSSGAGYGPTGGTAYPGYPNPTAQPGYGAQPGYPAYGQPQGGYVSADDKTYIMIAHWGGVAGLFIGGGMLGWVGPLVAYVSKGNQSPVVRAHAVTTLNFYLTWAGITLIAWVLAFCTFGLTLLSWFIPVVIGIIGSIKATNGEFYRYPMAIPLVK